MPDTPNGRVTLAVVQNEIQHIRDDLREYHLESCRRSQEMEARFMRLVEDHEARLRNLEGSQGWNIWRDVGAFMTAIGAFVAGLAGK